MEDIGHSLNNEFKPIKKAAGMQLIIAFLIGILIGILTGLTPGIHSNLAASAMVAYLLLKEINAESVAVMIIAMGVAHSILDTIPSIFLGMPDSEKIMSALPSHKMLFEGRGFEAVVLSVTGTLFGTILAVVTLPLAGLIFSLLYYKISWAIGSILLVLLTVLIMQEKNKFPAIIIITITGILGIAVFRLDVKEPLLPMLSGLFGVSALFLGFIENTSIPKQEKCNVIIKKSDWLKPSLISLLFGTFSAFLPGMGPSQVAALGSKLIKNITEKGYIILSSALSTINLIVGIAALYSIGKSRSGIIAAIQSLGFKTSFLIILLMVFAALAAGGISSIIAIFIAKNISQVLPKINYKKLSVAIILLVIMIVLIISGFMGILVLFTATAIGLLAPIKKISRQHMMGCILIPVILFFLGINL